MTSSEILTQDRAPFSSRKQAICDWANSRTASVRRWPNAGQYFHREDELYMRFLIPEGATILELGCGRGDLLAALKPARAVGVDFSATVIAAAKARHPNSGIEFHVGDVEDPAVIATLPGPFDFIILSDTIGAIDDCQALLESLHPLCNRRTRLVVAYYSHFWEPLLKIAEFLGLKTPQPAQNVLSTDDIRCLFELADFDMVKRDWRQLVPLRLFGLAPLINRVVGTLPGIRHLCLRNYVVGRSRRAADEDQVTSATVVIPCRNERGNIEPAIQRLPRFCDDLEVIFIEGHSQDGTYEEALRVAAAYPGHDIKVMRQDGKGKADAVFKAFDHARGDVLIILDADLTVPPEQVGKFWSAIKNGKGEFLNGTRLIYPMEKEAMRFLNFLANTVFSWLFTWLLNQRYTDTLCGTKVLRRDDYRILKANRSYFGDFDPFGDFDLIFGAAKMNLKTIEVPIRYASRRYGETQISRFQHGWLLLRMVVFAYRKLKSF